eukprot:TRINITY_DN3045_c0_g1_i2.p1 TRINITY_DN3045_c0_g1~~TRINITY_DN3045_c0_g1_i2.p1  ORF type:complete len:1075 (+),score=458.76 TRINITY_DN3045_c0_g1_i2:119-3343(+)
MCIRDRYDEIQVTRQVVIGGRNKYIINGMTAQQSRVQNLFHSVQLNVNNPHFLIMQGRITKVLNMKPEEFLAMIEEAAGTRMYEMKKANAEKTIQKKQGRVDEINQLLSEEITPQLETLRKQKDQYLQWTANNTEAERLGRFSTAYQYSSAVESLTQSADGMDALQAKMDELDGKQTDATEELERVDKHIEQLKEEKARQMSGEIKELEQNAVSLSKELVKKDSELGNANENQTSELNSIKALEEQKQELSASIEAKQAEHSKRCQDLSSHEEANMVASRAVTDLENKFAAMSAGASTSADAGCSKSLAEELADCKRTESEAITTQKQCELKLNHLKSTRKELTAALKKVTKNSGAEEAEHAKKLKNLQKLKQQLDSMPGAVDDGQLDQDRVNAEARVSELLEQVERSESQLASFEFQRGNDGRVKGRVAHLTRVKDPATMTALEVVAGGKLYQVVVDTVETGKKLMKNAKHSVTLIPLDKISDRMMDRQRLEAAQDAVGDADLCRLALDLVDHDPEVASAMKYVFGDTVICNTSENARRATFSKGAGVKSVTLDGDCFKPSGTLTGGSRPRAENSILAKITRLHELRSLLNDARGALEVVEAEAGQSKEKRKLFQQYSLQEQQVQLLEQRIAASTHGKLSQQLEDVLGNIDKTEECMQEQGAIMAKATKRQAELEAEMKDSSKSRDKALKQLEKQLASKKQERDNLRQSGREDTQVVEVLALEIEESQREVVRMDEQIGAAHEMEKEARGLVEAARQEYGEVKELYDRAQADLDDARELVASCDQTIATANKERKTIAQAAKEAEHERKRVEHKMQRFAKDTEQAKEAVAHLEAKYDWIKAEKQFFGRPHTDYDFDARSPEEVTKRLGVLEEEQAKLGKRINKKVMGMFEKAEQEYQELMTKKEIIQNDKDKIEAVISELDHKKCEALTKTWEKVNHDFGSIFQTLLPGTNAKLEPQEGKTVLDGLEVRVAFGGVWKQSLQELSGGQRSLLALSLVLAMLRFKPAPMYILDEVDAALDMSHTQNIGQMLKKHFPQSQFIVVSLKDGMFSNANVLFKTKFVDGLSTVMRTCNAK